MAASDVTKGLDLYGGGTAYCMEYIAFRESGRNTYDHQGNDKD